MKFLLVDISNILYRSGHALFKGGGRNDTKSIYAGCLQMTVQSISNAFHTFDCDHVVACFDHYRSWRKDVLPQYKDGRKEKREAAGTEEMFEEAGRAMVALREYLLNHTQVTVLHREKVEVDDFVGRWVAIHPSDNHLILSSDSDFKQLISPRVEMFDGTSRTLYRHDETLCSKVGEGERVLRYAMWWYRKNGGVDPSWELFCKAMLGDKTDNIPRAVRPLIGEKKLEKVFASVDSPTSMEIFLADRIDLDTNPPPLVLDLFNRNLDLVDLTRQPAAVVDAMDDEIASQLSRPRRADVRADFLNFCREHDLMELFSKGNEVLPVLGKSYTIG